MRGECSGKYPLDAFTVGDSAHGESFVEPATLPANHYASKYLDSFLVSFHHASVHAHAIANRKRFGIAFLLFFLNRIDDLIHKLVASRAAAGAHSHSKAQFANGNRHHLAEHEALSEQEIIRKSLKIAKICG